MAKIWPSPSIRMKRLPMVPQSKLPSLSVTSRRLSKILFSVTLFLFLYDLRQSPTGDKKARIMKIIFKQNTTIPTKVCNRFYNSSNNQTCVKLSVYEGEHTLVKHSYLWGTFILNDLPPGPRGIVSYEVTFEIQVVGVFWWLTWSIENYSIFICFSEQGCSVKI